MFVILGGGQAGQDFLADSSQSSETISNVTIALTSLIFDGAMVGSNSWDLDVDRSFRLLHSAIDCGRSMPIHGLSWSYLASRLPDKLVSGSRRYNLRMYPLKLSPVTAIVISVLLTQTVEGAQKPWYLITTYAALTLLYVSEFAIFIHGL
jgi:hypothetical protein